jgi:hypothetical protein
MKRETSALISLVLLIFIVFDPLHLLSGIVRFLFILFSSGAVPYLYLVWRGDKASDEHVWFPEDPASTGQYLMNLGQYGEVDDPARARAYSHPDVIRLLEHLERKRIEAEKRVRR